MKNDFRKYQQKFDHDIADSAAVNFKSYWFAVCEKLPDTVLGRFIKTVISDFVYDNAKADQENIDYYFDGDYLEFAKDLRSKIGTDKVINAIINCYEQYLPNYYDIECADHDSDISDISHEYYSELGYQLLEKPNDDFLNSLNRQQTRQLDDILKLFNYDEELI